MNWFFLSHTQKLSNKFDFLGDLQTRTRAGFRNFEALLLRGALAYKFNKKSFTAIGYTYKGDWTTKQGKSVYSPEKTIYEQYEYDDVYRKAELIFRFRQEQRFVKKTDTYNFSQRSRAFLSAQIPLAANADFTKGMFTTIQDEYFMNTQNKEKVNNSFFDQNVFFTSLGYRWSAKVDTEIGYLLWSQKKEEGNISTNVYQLVITTNF